MPAKKVFLNKIAQGTNLSAARQGYVCAFNPASAQTLNERVPQRKVMRAYLDEKNKEEYAESHR